jgi:ribosomal protein S18 acetylase RimI-like enzyme
VTVWLRPARPLDAGRIGRILQAFAEEAPWMLRLHSGAEAIACCGEMIDRGWVTVAGTGAKVDGFLACDDGYIHALYVAPGQRGRGLGARLIRAAQGGSESLSLWTFEANSGARRFYKRHGFAEEGRGAGMGNDECLPDIRYRWTRAA